MPVLKIKQNDEWVEVGGAGVSSWNDLEDKPFSETYSDTLTWDGNADGLVCIADVYYKVSDVVLSESDVNNIVLQTFAGTPCTEESIQIMFYDDGGGLITGMPEGTESPTDMIALCIIPVENYDMMADGSIIVPYPGIYACKDFSLTIPGYTGFHSIKTIDPKYLPANVATQEYIDEAVENIDNLAYINEEDIAISVNTINADTLGGYLPSMFAKQEAFDKVLDGIKPKAGFIYPLAGSVVPDGFLLCDGAAYSRTEYVELFTAIGTIYGEGDGSTTFNVPNLQTRVPVGAGSGYALGSTGGEAQHTLTIDEMPSHTHILGDYCGTASSGGNTGDVGMTSGTYYSSTNNANRTTKTTGGSQPHNNMQPYTVVNYIIATGKGNAVSVSDVVQGVQALPLGVEYGGTGATNAQTARENLGITPDNIGAVSMDLLWENASISSDFAGQTVSLDLSKYTHVIIDGTDFGSIIMLVNGTVYATALYGQTYYRTRFIKTTETGVIFDSGYVSYTNGTAQSRDNSNCKPYKIYGIKGAK